MRVKQQSNVKTSAGLPEGYQNLWDFFNKLNSNFSKIESKLNALQKHLEIEIIDKVDVYTSHKVITTKKSHAVMD